MTHGQAGLVTVTARLLSTLTAAELADADRRYPKWETMCQLRRIGLPVLDAVLVPPGLDRQAIRPVPQLTGGGQEYGLRAGTLNVPGIVGLGEAAAILAGQRHADACRIAGLRDQLLAALRQVLPDIAVNGSMIRRLPGNLNISFPGIDADQLIEHLPGLALSTGSACNTGQPEPSHVLTAIGLDRPAARSSIRIGLGRTTTSQETAAAARQIVGAAGRVQKMLGGLGVSL